ncbi:hypothetical protein RJT34_10987 [Clitoria ternatea]|uniref:Uncharacterized protein n=1 Tax=Clitoria ternatea TaxID=43366 RepID=A0AAN9JL80_CLITE
MLHDDKYGNENEDMIHHLFHIFRLKLARDIPEFRVSETFPGDDHLLHVFVLHLLRHDHHSPPKRSGSLRLLLFSAVLSALTIHKMPSLLCLCDSWFFD